MWEKSGSWESSSHANFRDRLRSSGGSGVSEGWHHTPPLLLPVGGSAFVSCVNVQNPADILSAQYFKIPTSQFRIKGLRKSKIKAKHDMDYFKHLSLEKQFGKQPKVRHSAVQCISQTKSSKCAMQWTWGQRWAATLCPLHEFTVKEEKWMHKQIIKCNEMDALWCKVAQRAECTVIHTRYKHLGGVVWNHHQSEWLWFHLEKRKSKKAEVCAVNSDIQYFYFYF